MLKKLPAIFVVLFLASVQASAAIPKDWASKDWLVSERIKGRIFYYTHGNAVYGHELGFIKTKGACSGDLLWISYSAADKDVARFAGKRVSMAFNIDGTSFDIDIDMLSARTLFLSQIMTFTNFLAGEELIKMMIKGRRARLKITAPPKLVEYLDVPEDTFSLIGFTAARQKAQTMCEAMGK